MEWHRMAKNYQELWTYYLCLHVNGIKYWWKQLYCLSTQHILLQCMIFSINTIQSLLLTYYLRIHVIVSCILMKTIILSINTSQNFTMHDIFHYHHAANPLSILNMIQYMNQQHVSDLVHTKSLLCNWHCISRCKKTIWWHHNRQGNCLAFCWLCSFLKEQYVTLPSVKQVL